MRPTIPVLLLALPAALPAGADDRPDVVVILADDLGIGDLGCYHPESRIPTPRMDRLAAAGMRFTDVHTPSAVCTPTRYGLLTGRYCWRSRLVKGVLYGYSPLLIEPGRPTLASLLAGAGYRTGCFGKWHLGLQEGKTDYAKPLAPGPLEVGFDAFFGIPASLDMEPYVFVRGHAPERRPTGRVAAGRRVWDGGEGYWRAGPIAPGFRHVDALPRSAAAAVAFIESAEPDRRLFAYVPLPAPHTPWVPDPAHAGTSAVGRYGDFVRQVDDAVGAVVEALSRAGRLDDTLLIVTSDNGSHWPAKMIAEYGHDANMGLRGMKADIHEGGHRVPFVVHWPARVAAGVDATTLCLTDVYATVAAVLGYDLQADEAEDGFSFLPLLLGQPMPPRPPVIHHSLDGTFAVRAGAWKLVEGLGSGGFTPPRRVEPTPGGPQGQLYRLADDPAERHDLWQERPEVVARLAALLDHARKAGRTRGDGAVPSARGRTPPAGGEPAAPAPRRRRPAGLP